MAGLERSVASGPIPIARDRRMTTSRRSWMMLVLLVIIGTLNYIDRVLPAILAEPIKRDIALSDTALGLINGAGFLVVYGAASIPLARMSDRGRYGAVIVLSVALWSAMTLVGGLVNSAWQLAASRVGVALGEAGAVPAAHAFINRHLSPERRTLGLSIFTLCLPFGSIAGFALGGIAGEQFGWRSTFIGMGVIGLMIAAISYAALPAEARKAPPAITPGEQPASLAALLRKRSLILTLLGSGLIAMGGYTGLAFSPAFLMRSHALSLSEAGLAFGIVGGITAIVMLLLLGWISDHLSRHDPRWLLGTVILVITVGMPLSIGAYVANGLGWALAGIAINHGIVISYTAPVFAALHRLAPLELRAQSSALFLLTGALIGGLGPLVAGVLSDALADSLGFQALARAMLIVPATYALGALCLTLALLTFVKEIDDDTADQIA